MKMNKKAVAGESILTIYRLVLITLIALIILGMAAVFYDYYVDVRNTEAQIMAREVVNCLAPEGVLDLRNIENSDFAKKKILQYCGFEEEEAKRFYISIDVRDFENEEVLKTFEQGDPSNAWVHELFKAYENKKSSVESIATYEPGYFKAPYSVNIIYLKESVPVKIKGYMYVGVVVNAEFE